MDRVCLQCKASIEHRAKIAKYCGQPCDGHSYHKADWSKRSNKTRKARRSADRKWRHPALMPESLTPEFKTYEREVNKLIYLGEHPLTASVKALRSNVCNSLPNNVK